MSVVGCASDRTEGALSVDRPPSPQIGDTGEGRDPLDDVPNQPSLRRIPLPPIADPGVLPAATGLPDPSDEGATLYVIGSRRITEADLGDFILRYFPDRARDPLGQLVDAALVDAEAERQGVDVPAALVQERTDAHIEARRKKVRVEYGAEATLEDLLESSFGRSMRQFEADARRLARIAILRDVLVRLAQIREERVEVRALTFPTEKGARTAVERLRTGADLTLLARKLGLREPAAPPPFARDEISPAERAAEVFDASPGSVLDPRAFTGPDGKTYFEVIKIVARSEARTTPWPELQQEVLDDLAARPVGVPEYLAWRRRTIRSAAVEVRREGQGLVPWLRMAPTDAKPEEN